MGSSNNAEQRRKLKREAEESVETAVRLATHAFDGLDLPDKELDELCDATLSAGETIPEDK